MKNYRVQYFIKMPDYPGGGIKRSMRIKAENAKMAEDIFMSRAKKASSSSKVLSVQEDHCKNCGK